MNKTKTVLGRTLEEIKDEVASDDNFHNWQLLFENCARYDYGRLESAIGKVAQCYAQSQTQELREQNAELVSALQSIVNLQDKYFGEKDIHRVLQKKVFEIEDILTKYNHLNQKP